MTANEEENLLEPSGAGIDQILESVRRARETNNINNNPSNNININTDQETQASDKVQDQQVQAAENASALDELTLDSAEDDENRNKR